jgi:AAA+ superfamily predicted ATPase
MSQLMQTTVSELEPDCDRWLQTSLLPALQRLDSLLERAVAKAKVTYGSEAATDFYRGLYINDAQVAQLLDRKPGEALFAIAENESEEALPGITNSASRLGWLQQLFDLSSFDLDVILIALAPELDRRYERLYGYLQDHVSRRQPSVDLVLNLLCAHAVERLERRVHFAADAPLIRSGLIHLIPDPTQPESTLLAHTLKLDEQVIRLLLGQQNLDSRLAPFCQWVEPRLQSQEQLLDTDLKQRLPSRVVQAWETQQPLRLYFYGPQGVGKQQVAERLSAEIGVPLLVVDLVAMIAAKTDFSELVQRLFREVLFQDGVLYLKGLEGVLKEEQTITYQTLLKRLASSSGITILAGTDPWVPVADQPLGIMAVPFSMPGFGQRRNCWLNHLTEQGITLPAKDLDALADRFRLTSNQIAEVVATACQGVDWGDGESSGNECQERLRVEGLFAAARQQSGNDLAVLARKVEPVYTWDDLILPEDTLVQLRELCQRVAHRHRVLDGWGFNRKLSLGKGVNTLFAGPSGTGKTMAAEIIASKLGLDLYKIDLSGVVSKYIGETEKNLNRIFNAAENANAILFFDEADALFGKRSEVRDSHDRYANIEISYLLQKMEEYEGLSILATNLNRNMDDAFVRRLTFMIAFPFPDEVHRERIWQTVWPGKELLANDVDLSWLARQFKLSGGNIKNIALAAAFLAVEEDGLIGMVHLLQAVRREYQKMGKTLTDGELNGYREQGQLSAKV